MKNKILVLLFLVSLASSSPFVNASEVPSITSISPKVALIEDDEVSVTIQGSNLEGVTSVHFGEEPAIFMLESPTSIEALAPESIEAKIVNVTVRTTDGTSETSNATQFHYVDEIVEL